MTYQSTGDSHHERLIRVEERLKHMDETQGIALRDLKAAISDLSSTAKDELVETRTRLTDLEKRVDKIYWLWSAAVFVGTPIMMAVSKFVFAKLGF
jgi:hypothetical protein